MVTSSDFIRLHPTFLDTPVVLLFTWQLLAPFFQGPHWTQRHRVYDMSTVQLTMHTRPLEVQRFIGCPEIAAIIEMKNVVS
jgi:hypothetical protein